MKNDKLAEAIKSWSCYLPEAEYGSMEEIYPCDCNELHQLVKSAKAYHELPVVDAEEIKCHAPAAHCDYHSEGYDQAIENLRKRYPNGLKWR